MSVLVSEHRLGKCAQLVRRDPPVAVGDAFQTGGASAKESCVPVSSHAKPRWSVCTFSSPLCRKHWFTLVISSSPRAEGLMLLATSTTLFG